MSALTADDIATIAEVIDTAVRARMEEVFGELEALKEQVRDAVQRMAGADIDSVLVTEVTARADESWRRFIETEAKHLGLVIVRPKS